MKDDKGQNEKSVLAALIVENVGAIARMELPLAWRESNPEQPDPGGFGLSASSRDFSPPGEPSACLSLFFRGTLISEGSAQRFKELLKEPEHELSQSEIESITQVLSKLADEDSFQRKNCSTLNITGRRVLVVDGEWKRSKTLFYGLIFGVDESGRVIQEVFFEAGETAFKEYLDAVLRSIRTIEWKG